MKQSLTKSYYQNFYIIIHVNYLRKCGVLNCDRKYGFTLEKFIEC